MTSSACIADRLHQTVSTSTLKRVWSYVASDTTPRLSTLDILAQFVGSKDWEDYTTKNTETAETAEQQKYTEKNGNTQKFPSISEKFRVFLLLLLPLTLILLGLWFFLTPSSSERETEGDHIIHKGQTFAHYNDIHRLFNIQVRDDAPWYQSVPHYDWLYVWTPQYQNPNWHNDGYYTFLLKSDSNTPIDGTSGGIITVTLVADATFGGGKIVIDNTVLTTPEEVEINPARYEYSLEGATAIERVEVVKTDDGFIYDLSGRRVTDAKYPGIYIRNGKKFYVK